MTSGSADSAAAANPIMIESSRQGMANLKIDMRGLRATVSK
jgi:hypothetical protein